MITTALAASASSPEPGPRPSRSAAAATSARRSSQSGLDAVVGVDERVRERHGALVQVGDAWRRESNRQQCERVRPPRAQRPVDETRERVVGGIHAEFGLEIAARAHRVRPRRSRSGAVHDVWRSASRADFTRYSVMRSAVIGQAVTAVCSASSTVAASSAVVIVVRPTTRRATDAHSSAISASASERARTPSERLVSWVVPASIVVGVRDCTSPWCCVECLDRRGEFPGCAADLAQRREPKVPVERPVLGTLGHRRAGQLFPPRGDSRTGANQSHDALDHLGQVGTSDDRSPRGIVELDHGGCIAGKVGAVAIDTERQLDQRLAQHVDLHSVERIGTIGRGEFGGDEADEPVEVGSETAVEHLTSRLVLDLVEAAGVSGQLGPQPFQRCFGGGVEERVLGRPGCARTRSCRRPATKVPAPRPGPGSSRRAANGGRRCDGGRPAR